MEHLYISSGSPILQGAKTYKLNPLLLFSFVGLRYRLRGGLGRAAIAPGGIAGESVGQDPPGSGELIADEAETQQPAAHGVALVLALQGLVFRSASVQRAIVHRQAELHIGLQLPRV